ncbi:MAG: dihydrofolate reductase [Hyphomicrobiales bacterium]|nr:dihydrofolate reductase [Hyphomicrobiales bacterium]MCP4999482.1 dihydrofolate reductase [Hyphomicrobiales bacterium]
MTASADASEIYIELVVAAARNGVIGRDGGMPWRLSTDLRRFKAITLGKPVVMGRKTFQSIGKALPGRKNIVITRDASFKADDVDVVQTVEAAIECAQKAALESGQYTICVIGGGEIYRQVLPLADCVHMTHVDCEPEGDTVFPEFDPHLWNVESIEPVPAGEKDSAASRYVVYRRKQQVLPGN